MSNQSNVILFVVNAPEFFLSHRFPLAVAAKKSGYEVHVATAEGPDIERIQAQGFIHHVVPFARSGQNPLNELGTLLCLTKLFRRVKPSLVHLITIKPVLYGGIAARLAGVKSVVSAVSGLGTVFLAESAAARLRRWLVTVMYRSAFKQSHLAVIFQNPDDRDALLTLKALMPEQARMIRGSGVTLSDYSYVPEPEGKPVVVMAARLLKDKGVFEFVEAARLLKQRGVSVEMRMIGSPDPGNPTSVNQQELDQWAAEGQVEFLGYRKDIAEQYAAANIVCLPSYREGLPKSLVEAAASGRIVVTTDVPGCRDAIIPDKTGLLVPVKNAVALADVIETLIDSPDLRKRMGQAGRALAEDAFAIEKIVEQHMDIYQELLKP
ncbi:glycosyltransferase family 4 protein [Oceanisphaera psychrotolerans]|uniref:Glycosyl transferase family 1 n=1 Tax=Oceanisphaera psychrotolerans TaxID=1414654 RepID=A0A1J4QCE8_9GAMM|nr:glycosyltransferase family 4 protein [Oceanisphaera psychrotolerans]OIN07768.1 glycosyl transferase family 1 [Oceanisphaera psychrotolerans]